MLLSCGGQADTDSINDSNTINLQPQANAGNDQNIKTGSLVVLDASNSTDPEQDELLYGWEFISRPLASSSTLLKLNTVKAEFIADVNGEYLLGLIVNDGELDSAQSFVRIISTNLNSAPVSNAGVNQNVSTNSLVTLNGGNSSDADGDNLTFNWVLFPPVNSSAILVSENSATPSFIADVDGTYTVNLVVNDGVISSSSDTVEIISSTNNKAPIANAGADQNSSTGDAVTLNGMNSSDADGDNLTFFWVLSAPVGSNAALNSSSSITPSFTADVDGFYVVSLTVNDGVISSQSDTVVVTSSTGNSAPFADAGIDQNVSTGNTVTLDASASIDVDGDSLFYDWVLTTKPLTSVANLVSENSINPTFTVDVDGDYIIRLTVNDGALTSQSDSVLVTGAASNNPPIADAGTDQIVTTGNLVMLNGSNSSDPNNDNLTFSWLLNTPNGSAASLNFSNIFQPSFTTDIDGIYIASLTVNDGALSSQSDSVLIQSTSPAASDFDSFDGNGTLTGYTTNNEADLPDVVRANGRYRANLVDNTNDKTLHYNNFQGRLDAKQVSFPFEVIARNIGIGSQTNSQSAPVPDGSQFIFAGVQIHVIDLNSRNSSHIVVGHRGGTSFTIEGKNTVNAASEVDDAGVNIAPDGRVDLRIMGNSDRSLTIYWQLPNINGQQDSWQLYDGYNSANGELPGLPPVYGLSVYVGLITYAQGQSNIPFVGTCDSFEIIQ